MGDAEDPREPRALLHHVFWFPRVSQLPERNAAATLATLVSRFVSVVLREDSGFPWYPSNEERAQLRVLTKVLSSACWITDYGCVLVSSAIDDGTCFGEPGSRGVRLLSVSPSHRAHSTPNGRHYRPSAQPSEPLFIPSFASAKDAGTHFRECEKKASRSASVPRSPAFVAHMFSRSEFPKPQRHGELDPQTPTDWPLVEAVILDQLRLPLARRLLVYLMLWLTQRHVSSIRVPLTIESHVEAEIASMVDDGMRMIDETCVRAEHVVHDDGRLDSALPHELRYLREQLEIQWLKLGDTLAAGHRLESVVTERCVEELVRDIPLQLPSTALYAEAQSERYSAAEEKANIRAVPIRCSLDQSSLRDNLHWVIAQGTLSKPFPHAIEYQRVLLEALFGRFQRLQTTFSVISETELLCLEEYCSMFERNSAALAAFDSSIMLIEQRSLELLVHWTAYCLAFDYARIVHAAAFNECGGFGVCLTHPHYLRHLQLREHRHETHAVSLAQFLHRWHPSHFGNRALFSLSDSASINRLGVAVFNHSTDLQQALDAEIRYAEQRKQRHWEEVQQKQAQVVAREAEVASCQRTYDEAEVEWLASKQSIYSSEYFAKKNASERLESAKTRLADARKPPAQLNIALPSNREDAAAVVFCTRMPQDLAAVFRVGCTAQFKYLQPEPRSAVLTTVTLGSTVFELLWTSHIKQHGCKAAIGSVDKLAGAMTTSRVPNVNPGCVTSMRSPDAGVWVPEGAPKYHWQPGGSKSINPFSASTMDIDQAATGYFVDKVSSGTFQPFFMPPASPTSAGSNRGNVAIAKQGSRPDWMRKDQFIALGQLRAFPRLQFRKLCDALKLGTLQLDQQIVHRLVEHVLFQIGDVQLDDDHGGASLRWRVDIDSGTVLNTLGELVSDHLERLRERIKDRMQLLGLASIAAFVASRCERFARLPRDCADVADGWASTLRSIASGSVGSGQSSIGHSRATQFDCYGIAINCFYGAPVHDQDLALLVRLTVDLRRLYAYKPAQEAESMLQRAHRAIVPCVERIAAAVAAGNHALLTEATRRAIPTTPSNLQWRLHSPTCSGDSVIGAAFTATCPQTEDIYTINVVHGIVLRNGVPPRRLPSFITSHPLYIRSFGKADFEVSWSKHGFYQSTHAANGNLYEFKRLSDDRLLIREWPYDTPDQDIERVRLELLEPSCEGLACLPIRLREMHSQWCSRYNGIVLLRPRSHVDHQVQFVLTAPNCTNSSERSRTLGGGDDWKCFEISPLTWDELPGGETLRWHAAVEPSVLEACDRIALVSDADGPLEAALSVLSKFEQRQFMHLVYSDVAQSLRLSLPRFGLTFELRPDCSEEPHSRTSDSTANGSTKFRLHSLDRSGFRLAESQQFAELLVGVTQYLVLEPETPEYTADNQRIRQELLLVPEGSVERDGAGVTRIVYADTAAAVLQACAFKRHARFQYLDAETIETRLLLAALFVATSVSIPDRLTRHTGEEQALELIHRSWTNKPLPPQALEWLHTSRTLSYHIPAIPIACAALERNSTQLAFLFNPDTHDDASGPEVQLPFLAASEYGQRMFHNIRQELTPEEEEYVLGCSTPLENRRQRAIDMLPADSVGSTHVVASPRLSAEVLKDALLSLEGLLSKPSAAPTMMSTAFPLHLDHARDSRSLQLSTLAEDLQDSWNIHRQREAGELQLSEVQLLPTLHSISRKVMDGRQKLEDYVLEAMKVPLGMNNAATFLLHIRQAANRLPVPTASDLLAAALEPSVFTSFNPLLSPLSVRDLHNATIVWLQLCVLEDKLTRVQQLLHNGAHPSVLGLVRDELISARREWDVNEHLAWLVLEVEFRFQIRPTQFLVFKELIENPGTIQQLNMGLGKTRVIIPMLLLYWRYGPQPNKKKRVIRVNVLSQLLNEAYDCWHERLGASVFRFKLFRMPFHRANGLTIERLSRMHQALALAARSQGVFVMAPEHRLSMYNKQRELASSHSAEDLQVAALLAEIESPRRVEMVDVFDEVDELLHHRYKLVYALGKHERLSASEVRFSAISAVLRAVAFDSELAALLEQKDIIEGGMDSLAASPRCEFPPLRLVSGTRLEGALPELLKRIVRALRRTDNTPELRWLASCSNADFEQLSDYMCDQRVQCIATRRGDKLELPSGLRLSKDQWSDVLALRGLLAYGTLAHCLKLRYRVDYGLRSLEDAENGAPRLGKRLAVPFRAANTPAERAEFAHPDSAVILTQLSYYRQGLNRQQFQEALAALLALGPSAQHAIYNETWLPLCAKQMDDADRTMLDSVEKLDLSNSVQIDTAWKYFSHNYEVVNHWLARCVLPRETAQFPMTLEANAWTLARDPARSYGFSGTNDNALLLPLSMQKPVPEMIPEELRATNGGMLDLLCLHRNSEYFELPSPTPQAGDHEISPVCRALLEEVVSRKRETEISALIDTGALLGGVSNITAAKFLIRELERRRHEKPCARGVVFFNDATLDHTHQAGWCVMGPRFQVWALARSPIAARDAIVLFDQPRCRGADFRLKNNAVALLTVGPTSTKDQLIQGAGRMRMLAKEQRVIFVGRSEVSDKVREYCKLEADHGIWSRHILQWALHNTAANLQSGLLQWALHGIKHFATQFEANNEAQVRSNGMFLSLNTTLEVMYQRCTQTSTVAEAINDYMLIYDQRHKQRTASVREIETRCLEYGRDCTIEVSERSSNNDSAITMETECERELEREVELEEQRELQLPVLEPRKEQMWEYASALSVTSPDRLPCSKTLAARVAGLHGSELVTLAWSACNPTVYCTENFWYTSTSAALTHITGAVDDAYLRPVDAFLRFPTGEVLLVSEFEAESILAALAQNPTTRYKLGHLSLSSGNTEPQSALGVKLHTETHAVLSLFAGETAFAGAQLAAARSVVQASNAPREACAALLDIRGRKHNFAMSSLEGLCRELAPQ